MIQTFLYLKFSLKKKKSFEVEYHVAQASLELVI